MASLFAAHKHGVAGDKSDMQGLSTDDSRQPHVIMTFDDIERVLPLAEKTAQGEMTLLRSRARPAIIESPTG